MKYVVRARYWNKDLAARFGEQYAIVTLDDSQVIEAIECFWES